VACGLRLTYLGSRHYFSPAALSISCHHDTEKLFKKGVFGFFTAFDLITINSSDGGLSMVRHKKDGLSSKSKKYSTTPRHKAIPKDGEEASSYVKPPFKAACWDLGHCDPKRCSGKRLMHFGMMRELPIGQKFPGVVIS
jgi:Possible Fer4-like domain in RNase L inhibitor, RLI